MTDNLSKLPSPALPQLAPRAADSHKGDYGSALLIGGSRGMAGAIALAGLAALRGGAGLVRLAVPDRCLESVAAHSPCFMTIPLADDPQGKISGDAWAALSEYIAKAACVAVGPGLGQSRDLQQLLQQIVRHARCPLVIDADGLNNLADVQGWSVQRAGPTVITPHPGEWSRLCGVPASDRAAQCAAAVACARDSGIVVVLKGSQTLITDGHTAVFNHTGTPAMATGGSGDVLTGLLTALICQKMSTRDAAHLAVHAHGQAGQLAQQASGAHVVLPTDLIAHFQCR